MEAASRLLRYSLRPLHRLLEKSKRKAVSTRGTTTPSQLFHLRRSMNLPSCRLLPAPHLRSLAMVPVLSAGSGFRVSSRLFPVVQGQLHVTSSPFPNSWACCPPWEMVSQGMETTTLLAEWAITELVLHTDVQAKLRHEVDAIMGTPGSIPASCSQVPRIHPDTCLLPGGWTPSAPSPNFVTATRLPLGPNRVSLGLFHSASAIPLVLSSLSHASSLGSPPRPRSQPLGLFPWGADHQRTEVSKSAEGNRGATRAKYTILNSISFIDT